MTPPTTVAAALAGAKSHNAANENAVHIEISPAEQALITAGLAPTAITSVRVDGLALAALTKHARETHQAVVTTGNNNTTPVTIFYPAAGQLLGLDSPSGTLEVSGVLPLPAGALGGASNDPEPGFKAAALFTHDALPKLADVNAAAAVVGFYMSTTEWQQAATNGFLAALALAQLHGGGIGAGYKVEMPPAPPTSGRNAPPVVKTPLARPMALPAGHGAPNAGLALVYDTASVTGADVGLRAFRLSPAFIEVYRSGRYDSESLIANDFVPSEIFQEIPVTLHSSNIFSAYLATQKIETPYSSLALGQPQLSTHVQNLLSALDSHQSHLSTLSFQIRQLARERTRVESLPNVIQRKEENERRAKEGQPPLPLTKEESALTEPSRLDTLASLNAVTGSASVLSEATGTYVVQSLGSRIAL